MNLSDDGMKLLQFLEDEGIDGGRRYARGWDHLGGVIVDAVLQRQRKYIAVVRPRVVRLIEEWPDADTVTGMRRRIDSGTLAEAISWRGGSRLQQISELTTLFELAGIDTVDDLRTHLIDPELRTVLRRNLRTVKYVGPKTVDYFDILVGLDTGVAIDSRVRRVASKAGIGNTSYAYLAALIHEVAEVKGWRPGDLDAAIWAYQPDQVLSNAAD